MGTVIIMRGVSGSGKSTFVRSRYPEAVVCTADDFFITPEGGYFFDREKLGEAHNACLRKFVEAIQSAQPLIVVDNTNTELWEIAPYRALGLAYGYDVQIVTLLIDPHLAAARNTHNVPFRVVSIQEQRVINTHIPPFWNSMVLTADSFNLV